jgi:hypothetical protein
MRRIANIVDRSKIYNQVIVVVCNSMYNSWRALIPSQGYSNTWIVSSLATSDVDIWNGESIPVNLSQLF